MERALLCNRRGFDFGVTPLVTKARHREVQFDFSIVRMSRGEHFAIDSARESVLLLLTGEVTMACGEREMRVMRQNYFDEAPSALHAAPSQPAQIRAHADAELVLVETDNDETFASEIFTECNMLENEHRGQGLLNDTAHRMVRTIFDKRNRPTSNLVLGEVVTFPGCWSSYPPHYHAQPEVYHYRFTEPQGYGHAELGEQVCKVHQFDTLMILDDNTHAQVSAPGYGMFYVWVIRHLPNDPYVVPKFVDEHAWTKESSANLRVWQSRH